MTDDVYSLLRAIREQPDEDTPRLMLADEIATNGFDLAAEYIREDVAHASVRRKKNFQRTKLGIGYIRWLESLFALPVSNDATPLTGICAGEGWDSFCWRTLGHERRCELFVERGLPTRLKVTAPMFMERAPKLFLFPLTGCRLVDRSPERDDYENPQVWVWGATYFWPEKHNTWEEEVAHIPKPVHDLLPKQTNFRKGRYSNRPTAHAALQLVALVYGRKSVA